MKYRWVGIILGALLLLNRPLLAETDHLRPDMGANDYEALKEFLFVEGYWDEETAAVLGPLDGVLNFGNGTPHAHLVMSLDDIPGLRPLPDGVAEFIDGPYRVYYVAVGDDRLLVGIANRVTSEPGKIQSSEYRFKKYDLIEGTTDAGTDSYDPRPDVISFLFAHGSFLGPALRILVVGFLVLLFLAVRLRRSSGQSADPVVAAHRFAADARIFQVSGGVWVGLLVAAYGLMHFTARIGFLEAAATSDLISPALTHQLATTPDRLRLWSFAAVMVLSLLAVGALGLWSGALGGGRSRPGDAARGGRP